MGAGPKPVVTLRLESVLRERSSNASTPYVSTLRSRNDRASSTLAPTVCMSVKFQERLSTLAVGEMGTKTRLLRYRSFSCTYAVTSARCANQVDNARARYPTV